MRNSFKLNQLILSFFLVVAFFAFLITAVIIYNYNVGNITPKILILPDNTYSETLIAVADQDYSPYSFIDEEGNISGHDIEVIYALANELGVNIELRAVEWSEAKRQFHSGEADLILGLEYNPNALPNYEVTIPINADPIVAFAKENSEISIDQFYSSRLCTIEYGGAYDGFIRPYKLESVSALYESYAEAFESVENGINDYVLAPYTVGRRTIADRGFEGLDAAGPILVSNSNCIGTRAGDDALLHRLNDGLVALINEGVIEEINNRWLGEYVQIITLSEYFERNTAKTIVLLIAFILFSFIVFAYIIRFQKKANDIATLNEACFKALAEQTNKVIFEWDFAANRITSMSNFNALFGRDMATKSSAEDAIDSKMVHEEDADIFKNIFSSIMQGKNVENVKFRVRDVQGCYLWCSLSGIVINDSKGKPYKAIGSLENINKQVQKEEYLTKSAQKDQLTDLYNKATTELLIRQVLRESRHKKAKHALIIIDVDNFKQVNDRLGHMYGDRVLAELAGKLRRIFRLEDIVGRVGGDEFFVFLKNCSSRSILENKAKEIGRAFHNCYTENGVTTEISASIGIALYPEHGESFELLYEEADTALYVTKERGKSGYTVFDKAAQPNQQSI